MRMEMKNKTGGKASQRTNVREVKYLARDKLGNSRFTHHERVSGIH